MKRQSESPRTRDKEPGDSGLIYSLRPRQAVTRGGCHSSRDNCRPIPGCSPIGEVSCHSRGRRRLTIRPLEALRQDAAACSGSVAANTVRCRATS